jgi:glycyl-radical enzyme activating protein
MKGIVFDIQRTSLHDGPGIRTTVFLKGCPLRCLWCHNPESQSPKPELMYSADTCVACGACDKACPVGVHRFDGDTHTIDRGRCTLCGACVEACLYGALKMAGEERDVRSVIDEVVRDKAFYEQSGGGMTLSGGEPMMQFAFSRELLRAAREQGIHTCMETCGQAPSERYAEIDPLVDLYLYDYKGADARLHKEHTGVGTDLILRNLDLLYAAGTPIVVRCPLVPGLNDTDENLRSIAELDRTYPDLQGIELLAYHAMGVDKSRRIGRTPDLSGVATAEQEQKQRWLGAVRGFGCGKAVIG